MKHTIIWNADVIRHIRLSQERMKHENVIRSGVLLKLKELNAKRYGTGIEWDE